MVVAFCLVIGISLQIFAQPIIGFFMGEEISEMALWTGMADIRFTGCFYVFLGGKMAVDGVLRGAGDVKMFTIANLVNLTIRVVLAVTLAPRIGVQMVWIAVPLGWLANLLISGAQYRTGKWRKVYAEKASII
jgi:Na+-driven multidrug efflux pump